LSTRVSSRTPGGAYTYSAPPDPLAVFRGLLLKGREGRERGEGREGAGEEKMGEEGGERKRGEGKGEEEVRGEEGRDGREFVLCARKKKSAPMNAHTASGSVQPFAHGSPVRAPHDEYIRDSFAT